MFLNVLKGTTRKKSINCGPRLNSVLEGIFYCNNLAWRDDISSEPDWWGPMNNLCSNLTGIGRSRTHNPLFQNILFINYTNILLALCCSIWLKALVNHAIWFVFYRTRVRSLFSLVTNWLTDSCLVNLIDVTLACEDGNSKLVEILTVADVDNVDHVGNSFLQI